MAKKIKAYVDTSAFIAFLDASDYFHKIFSRLFANPPRLVTTPLVIAEGHGWFLKRFSSERAIEFLNFIEDLRPLEIVSIGPSDIASAKKYIKKFMDQDLTMVDATGLWLMGGLKVNECWSTDRHLGLTGKKLAIY